MNCLIEEEPLGAELGKADGRRGCEADKDVDCKKFGG